MYAGVLGGRFADYMITMPLIIVLLGQVAAADGATIAATVGGEAPASIGKTTA